MADLDRTVNPCDDFFQFSGGNWLKNNPVPSYASSWGPRNLLGNRTQTALRQILEDAAANQSATPGTTLRKWATSMPLPWTRWPSKRPASGR